MITLSYMIMNPLVQWYAKYGSNNVISAYDEKNWLGN